MTRADIAFALNAASGRRAPLALSPSASVRNIVRWLAWADPNGEWSAILACMNGRGTRCDEDDRAVPTQSEVWTVLQSMVVST